jgi:hypothetical protein
MDVCVVLYKDSSMKDKKGLHSTKKNPTGAWMFVLCKNSSTDHKYKKD